MSYKFLTATDDVKAAALLKVVHIAGWLSRKLEKEPTVRMDADEGSMAFEIGFVADGKLDHVQRLVRDQLPRELPSISVRDYYGTMTFIDESCHVAAYMEGGDLIVRVGIVDGCAAFSKGIKVSDAPIGIKDGEKCALGDLVNLGDNCLLSISSPQTSLF